MDHSSNRTLSPNGPPGEGGFVTLDALLARTTSTLDLDLHSGVAVQRFTNNSATDTLNRSLSFSGSWTRERSKWSLAGSYSDASTLTTEIASTGVVQGNTHQRQENVSLGWEWQQSEKRQFVAQANDSYSSYVGAQSYLLPGYRYPGGSLSERFTVSDRDVISLAASGGDLHSGASNIDDEQLSIALDHSFSERFTLSASAGVNDRSDHGRKIGYVGAFSLKRVDERNHWALEYSRTISASGYGVLTQRSAAALSFSRDLAFRLNAGLSLSADQDRQSVISGSVLVQSRLYAAADASLNWLSGETSTVSLAGGYSRATISSQPPTPLAHGWRMSITYRWTPRPSSFSR